MQLTRKFNDSPGCGPYKVTNLPSNVHFDLLCAILLVLMLGHQIDWVDVDAQV